MTPDRRLYKKPADLTPSSPATGHSQPGCYLAFTRDCGGGLSGEHYISRTVLEQVGKSVKVSGVPWLPEGTSKEIGINSLTANVLCSRHNSALSPLDAMMGNLIAAQTQMRVHLNAAWVRDKVPVRLFSGEDFELGLLKALCGVFHGRIAAANRERLSDDHTLDAQRVEDAFRSRIWQPGCGLYLNANVGTGFALDDDFRLMPLINAVDRRLSGTEFFFGGIQFVLILDPIGANIPGLSVMVRRPSELIFEKGNRKSVIMLTWARGTQPRRLHLKATDQPVTLGAIV